MGKLWLNVDLMVEVDDSYIPAMLDGADKSLEWAIARKELVLDILHEAEKSTGIIAKATISDITVELA